MLSKNQIFVVMMVTGPSDAPTWAKVGKGRKSRAKAEKAAKALAEKTPDARFYVMATVAAYKKAPTVCSRSYGQKAA